MKNLVFPSDLRARSIFFKELAQLTRAGFVAGDAFAKLNRATTSHDLRILAANVSAQLKKTKPFDQILKALQMHMPPLDLAMMLAGHHSGRLEQCYETLATYYQQSAQIRSQVITQLLYPLALAHGALLVFPMKSMGILYNDGLLAFVRMKFIPLILLWAVIAIPLLILTDQSDTPLRRQLERWLHKIPVFGSALAYASLSRFCMSLEGLVSAGINPDESWPLAAKASGSFLIQDAVNKIRGGVRTGKPPADLLQHGGVFPTEFIEQMQTAHQAGEVDLTLKRLSNYYGELAFGKFQMVSAWVPRVVYVLVLIAIAYNIVTSLTQATDMSGFEQF